MRVVQKTIFLLFYKDINTYKTQEKWRTESQAHIRQTFRWL